MIFTVELLHHDVSHGCLAEGFDALLPWLKGLLFIGVELNLVLWWHAVVRLELRSLLIEIRVMLRWQVVNAVLMAKSWLLVHMVAL